MAQPTEIVRRGYSDTAIYPENTRIVSARGTVAQRIGQTAIIGETPAEQVEVAMGSIAAHLEQVRRALGLTSFGMGNLAEVQIFVRDIAHVPEVSKAYLGYLDRVAGRTLTDAELPTRAMVVASPPLPEAEPPAPTAHVEILARASTIPPTFLLTHIPPEVALTAPAPM